MKCKSKTIKKRLLLVKMNPRQAVPKLITITLRWLCLCVRVCCKFTLNRSSYMWLLDAIYSKVTQELSVFLKPSKTKVDLNLNFLNANSLER